TLAHQSLDDAPDVAQRLADFARVLAGELDDLRGIPHDMILANLLEPERRDADRRLADLRVPDEEAGRKCLAVNLRPACRIDEEAEEILLPGVEAGGAVESLRRRLEVHRELAEHRDEIDAPEARVGDAVDGANRILRREDLEGLAATRQRLSQGSAGGVG